jgi:hypothetical protein
MEKKVAGILFLFALVLSACEEKMKPISFDRELWLAGDWKVRGSMVDQLMDDSLLIGKSRSELCYLLECDSEDSIGNLSYPVDIGLKTGPFGLGGIWLFSLNVHFDSLTDKVTEVRCRD